MEERILVVDDDERVRSFLVEVLEAQGFEVMEAATGPDGLERARARPDLVVLDADLPGTSGFDVCRRLKLDAATSDIPVLMVSGIYRETEDKARALEDGSDAYLAKPVTTRELLATVRAMLRIRSAERQNEERRRTEEKLRHHVAQAKSMVEVARAITSSLDLQAVLERIVDQACLLLGTDRCALAVLEGGDVDPVIRFVALRGLSTQMTEHRPEHWRDGTTPAAIAERRPVWSPDLLSDKAFTLKPATRRLIETEGYRAVLSVPLLAGTRTLGAIVMYRNTPGPFSDDDVDLLQVFAAQASVALENAELYRQAEQRRREAEVMTELARDINASLDPDTVLQRVAQGARDLCRADFSRIALREADGTTRFRYSPGARVDSWQGFRIDPGKGTGGQVLLTGQPFRTEDYLADPRISKDYAASAIAEGAVAEMVVPIRSQDDVQGLLYVTNRARRSFTDHDEAILTRLANYAGAAIQNARLYEELRQAHERLERSQSSLVQTERLRALGEMAAGVAHDFNNLLAVILGRTELLIRRGSDPDTLHGLELVRRAAQDGADTVRRIQEFTRTRQTRPFERVDVAEIVRETVELNRPRWKDEAQSRGVRYDVIVDGEAPPIAGRPEELREVFANLLKNALEAMPEGGTCQLRIGAGPETVAISISDTGVGMPPEVQHRVFEPFFTSKGPRGTGLGLAVSWSIVNRHGGTIEVRSAPGAGTTFVVRLPIPGQMPRKKELPAIALPTKAARVLVIEDEPAVRGVLVDLLREAGYTVTEAADGMGGLASCEREVPDLVLTDLSMPGLSGWDVAARCRERFPQIPIGLVTGWGDQLEPERVAGAAIGFVLAKPFRADDVLREIARALGGG